LHLSAVSTRWKGKNSTNISVARVNVMEDGRLTASRQTPTKG